MDGVPEARSHTLGHGDVGVRTNNTSHNGCLQVKPCGQKGVLRGTQQLPLPLR